MGDQRGAAEAFAIALGVNRGMRQALLRQAEALAAAGDRAEALALLDRALRADSASAGALIQRGELKEKMFEHEAATEDFSRFIELFPDQAEGYRRRAAAWFAASRLDAAEKDYSRAVALLPDDASLALERGRVRYLEERWTDAAEDLRRAASLDPRRADEAKAYLERIRVRLAAKR